MTAQTIADIERALALALQQPPPTEQQLAEDLAVGIDAMLRSHGGSAELSGVADGIATFLVSFPPMLGFAPAPSPARPNGCHNRAPFKDAVELRDHHGRLVESFPFRMATDCQYTKSDLGQADTLCQGCRWRHEKSDS